MRSTGNKFPHMNNRPDEHTRPETFILAAKDEHGCWQKIETASVEEGETTADVKAFLQTMAHANSRNYVEMDILTEAEFAVRSGKSPMLAA